ncbi:MAG: hypothetical protein IKY83_06765 [Proteobacteria bacterium]|nr:hypothetical protein [Pseudomonadota bacterium]
MSDTTSTQASGCDLKSIVLPIILAGVIIAIMLVMGQNAAPYSSPLRSVEPTEGYYYRLECVVTDMDHSRLRLCDGDKCLDASAPPEIWSRLRPGSQVIASGVFREGHFQIASILTRCSHEKGP